MQKELTSVVEGISAITTATERDKDSLEAQLGERQRGREAGGGETAPHAILSLTYTQTHKHTNTHNT
jgi:hypothetical protein